MNDNDNELLPSDIENLRIVREAQEFHELMMTPLVYRSAILKSSSELVFEQNESLETSETT